MANEMGVSSRRGAVEDVEEMSHKNRRNWRG
jgi:hypothetical protein